MIKINPDFSNAVIIKSNRLSTRSISLLIKSDVSGFWAQVHSHQPSFLQRVFVFKINEGSTYGRYIQVTKMSTTPADFDHPPVKTKMIRLQTKAHTCESRQGPRGNSACIFIAIPGQILNSSPEFPKGNSHKSWYRSLRTTGLC